MFGGIAYCIVKYAAPTFRAQTVEFPEKSQKAPARAKSLSANAAKSKSELEGLEREIGRLRVDASATPKPKRSACATWAVLKPKRSNWRPAPKSKQRAVRRASN